MAEEIKSVIFDIGGVIVKDYMPGYYSYLSRLSGHKARKVRELIEKATPGIEKGKTTIEAFEHKVASSLGMPVADVLWYEYFEEHVTVNVDVMDLIEELHDDYVIAYLSNIDRSKYGYTKKVIGSGDFDYRFASCDIGMRKPEPRIFRYALRKMKLMPKETVFIDNQLENVQGARGVGIHSILYKGRRQLDIELARIWD